MPGKIKATALPDDLAAFAALLGHRFARPALLIEALTHPSAAGRQDGPARSFERLEFLGDRVLGLIVADLLIHRYPGETEGALALRLADLVRRDTLAEVARGIGLGAHLRLAKGEEAGGERGNPAILADACEAVIGAVYLDAGLAAARALVEPLWGPLLDATRRPPQDAKTALQEWAQGRGLPLPDYREVGRSGPDHEPVFIVKVAVEGHGAEVGEGRSKRLAEQAAAERLIARLRAAP